MNRLTNYSLGLMLAVSCLAGAFAHEGEDHGPPQAVNARPLLPRVTAHSDLFEVVGVLEPGRLLVYVDATATNAPVTGASVEVEGANVNAGAKAAEVAPGVYEIKWPSAPAPGQHPLTFTVQAGNDMDLLGAPLVVPQNAPAASPTTAAPTSHTAWGSPIGWVAAGAAVTAAAMTVLSALRRRCAAQGKR